MAGLLFPERASSVFKGQARVPIYKFKRPNLIFVIVRRAASRYLDAFSLGGVGVGS